MTALPRPLRPFLTPPAPAAGPDHSLQGPVRQAVLAFGLLLGIFGFWASNTVISGAVVAQGQVSAKAQAQQVQSLEGGTVQDILVRNGDHVRAGQVLVRFDPTLNATNLGIAEAKLADALALQARLEAEEQGLPAPLFAPVSATAQLPFPAPDMTREIAGQRQIFAARAAVLQGQRARLAETMAQLDSQQQGLRGQIAAKGDEIALTEAQIGNQQTLVDQGLARQSQLTDLRRAHAALLGQMAALEADQAKLAIARRDAELETLQGERGFQEKVVTELRDTTAKVQELVLEIVTRREQLARTELRAPLDGIIHELKLTTLGGVVAPGATMLEVIPVGSGLDFELQVDPRAIDQVQIGQKAELTLAAFDPRRTPKLKASVIAVSPDAITDPRTGHSYYRIDLAVSADELARLDGQQVVPGMPITAYLTTTDRSVLAYLLHPLTSQMDLAFRED